MRKRYEVFGTLEKPMKLKPGPEKVITEEAGDYLLELLVGDADYYLEELQYQLLVEFEIYPSTSTISRYIKSRAFSRKRLQRHAAQRDSSARAAYWLEMGVFGAEQLIFVDESAANERSAERKWGFSPRGLPATVSRTLHRSQRWSILPALTIDGYIGQTLITQGSVTGDLFYSWLRDALLPQCNSYPGTRSVIIMDNCSTHRNQVTLLYTSGGLAAYNITGGSRSL